MDHYTLPILYPKHPFHLYFIPTQKSEHHEELAMGLATAERCKRGSQTMYTTHLSPSNLLYFHSLPLQVSIALLSMSPPSSQCSILHRLRVTTPIAPKSPIYLRGCLVILLFTRILNSILGIVMMMDEVVTTQLSYCSQLRFWNLHTCTYLCTYSYT